MSRIAPNDDQITSIIRLAQQIGWLQNLDETNRNILFRELGSLHITNLRVLQRELEQRLQHKSPNN
jgi:hypothetical protein